jgi:hypothetical protein
LEQIPRSREVKNGKFKQEKENIIYEIEEQHGQEKLLPQSIHLLAKQISQEKMYLFLFLIKRDIWFLFCKEYSHRVCTDSV